MKNSMSFLPILSAALFVSLLPNETGITGREHVDIGAVCVAGHSFDLPVRP